MFTHRLLPTVKPAGGPGPDLRHFVRFTPNGYAAQASARVMSGSGATFGARFRRRSGTVYIFGHSDNNSIGLYITATQLVSTSAGLGITLNYATNTTDFYRVEVDRYSSGSSIKIYDDEGNLLASNTAAQLASLSVTYASRQSNAYSSLDLTELKIGNISDRNQHIWNTPPVGTSWIDTGTVGGWNFTLAGSPLPTWQSEPL